MDNQKLLKLNHFITMAYQCSSFNEFLKFTIVNLHQFVLYDSGMFFCAISKDCNYFKPYIGGPIEDHYRKQCFRDREAYIEENGTTGKEAYVYKSTDYRHGIVQIESEPRNGFLMTQTDFYIVCMRIIHKGQFLGEIYLHRSKDKLDFDDEDMFVLRLLQPHVSTIFNIIHTMTAVKTLENDNISVNHLGLCVFDGEMSLVGGNLTGVEFLKMVTVFGSSLLYHVKEICMDIYHDGIAGTHEKTGWTNAVVNTPNGDINIDIFSNKVKHKTQFVVVMQYSDDTQVVADYKFKFTKREADIIDGLIQGKNNIQLAEALNLSANTIKTHIKSIYKKTGANSRAELTYMIMMNRDEQK